MAGKARSSAKKDEPKAGAPVSAPVVAFQAPQANTTSRSVAKMTISFGLVTVPVKLYGATDDHSITFRQVTTDGERVKMRRFAGETEVGWDDIQKGYELPDGSMVILTKDDMTALTARIDSSKQIDVKQFVDLDSVDPLALSGKSYFIAPDKVATTAYSLLLTAMQRTGKAAVATVTLRNRESVCVLLPRGKHLIMIMLNWSDEIRIPSFESDPVKAPSDVEVEMAERLVSALSGDFDISAYQDHYTNALAEIVTLKMKGGTVPAPADAPAEVEQSTVADALAASLAALKAS